MYRKKSGLGHTDRWISKSRTPRRLFQFSPEAADGHDRNSERHRKANWSWVTKVRTEIIYLYASIVTVVRRFIIHSVSLHKFALFVESSQNERKWTISRLAEYSYDREALIFFGSSTCRNLTEYIHVFWTYSLSGPDCWPSTCVSKEYKQLLQCCGTKEFLNVFINRLNKLRGQTTPNGYTLA